MLALRLSTGLSSIKCVPGFSVLSAQCLQGTNMLPSDSNFMLALSFPKEMVEGGASNLIFLKVYSLLVF